MGDVVEMKARQPAPKQEDGSVPFGSVETAWFWTMRMLIARRDGAGPGFGSRGIRVCDPDDVVKCLDRLYRQRRIELHHARVLRIYGERGMAPNPRFPSESADLRLWRAAMTLLDGELVVKGIVRKEQPRA